MFDDYFHHLLGFEVWQWRLTSWSVLWNLDYLSSFIKRCVNMFDNFSSHLHRRKNDPKSQLIENRNDFFKTN